MYVESNAKLGNVPAAESFWISTSMDMEYGIWNMDIGHGVGVAVCSSRIVVVVQVCMYSAFNRRAYSRCRYFTQHPSVPDRAGVTNTYTLLSTESIPIPTLHLNPKCP